MFFALLVAFLLPAPSLAARECRPTWSSDGSFFGGTCDSMGIRNSAGRTVAALGEIMRVNPAVLPTLPTPLGAELNIHNRGFGPQESRSEVHLVKGFPWLGLGIGSWNTGSMVGSDLPALFEGSPLETSFQLYDRSLPSRSGYRFGTSVRLPILPRSTRFRLRVGLTVGSGKVAGESAAGLGGVMDAGPFYFSVSSMSEKFGTTVTTSVDTSTYALGVDAGTFHAGYTHSVVRAARRMPGASTLTLRFSGDTWTVFGSLKVYENYRGMKQSWPSATIHRNFGDHFTAGYLYGLYRDSHSLSLQVFL